MAEEIAEVIEDDPIEAAHDGEHALATVHIHRHGRADVHLARALRRIHDSSLRQNAADLKKTVKKVVKKKAE